MIEVAELTVKLVAAVEPNLTAVAPVNLVPVIVTEVPPAAGPALGSTLVTVGLSGSMTSIASWAFVASAKPWKTTVAGCPAGSISGSSMPPMAILPCRYSPLNSASPMPRPHAEVAFDLILPSSISVVTSCVDVPALGSFLYSRLSSPVWGKTVTTQPVSPMKTYSIRLPVSHSMSSEPSGLPGGTACSL